MYRDTEEEYKGWTLDVYQSVNSGDWICDYIFSGSRLSGQTRGKKKLAVVTEAQNRIDEAIKAAAK